VISTGEAPSSCGEIIDIRPVALRIDASTA
jgi:hypothetical protein